MGCCLSTTNGSATDQERHNHNPSPDPAKIDRSPPPVEETVKEVVLSETPISKPPDVKMNKSSCGEKDVDFEQVKIAVPAAEVEVDGDPKVVSEPSEMCSFTESISTTATERRDDDGEVNQRSPLRGAPRKRRNPGDLAGGRDRSFRSPARRSTPSPEKRNALASSRAAQSRQTATPQRRNVGFQNGAQRDSGTTRRSRSPATRQEVDARRNVRDKSPAVVSENVRSPARSAENNRDKVEKPNDDVSEETGESLENPLVSLECFIFL